jgi:Flp pilus assembly secretin CpaC
MRIYRIALCSAVLLCLLAGTGSAQQKPPEAEKGPIVKVQIVLAHYEGDRKISSLPFTILATANGDRASIRTGTQVPIATASQSSDKTSYQYVDVGTNLDCGVKTTENGRYNVYLSISDRSVIDRAATAGPAAPLGGLTPVLRNFSYNNSILLKDGESKQFVAASDKGSAEIIKVDVTLNLEK